MVQIHSMLIHQVSFLCCEEKREGRAVALLAVTNGLMVLLFAILKLFDVFFMDGLLFARSP